MKKTMQKCMARPKADSVYWPGVTWAQIAGAKGRNETATWGCVQNTNEHDINTMRVRT